MGYLKFKLANGDFFHAALGTVHDVKRHKRPNKAVVLVAWGAKHGRSTVDRTALHEMVAVGDWRKLHRRWQALQSAG